jgi:hypothetical protein
MADIQSFLTRTKNYFNILLIRMHQSHLMSACLVVIHCETEFSDKKVMTGASQERKNCVKWKTS